MDLKEALNICNKHVEHSKQPYCCTEYKDKYAFAYPDGGSVVHVVHKKDGKHEIVCPLYQDLGQPLKVIPLEVGA